MNRIPLTGKDEEWINYADDDDGTPLYQNRLQAGVFKDGDNGQPYYIDALSYVNPDGTPYPYYTLKGDLPTTRPIENFPWLPPETDYNITVKDNLPLDPIPDYAPNAYQPV